MKERHMPKITFIMPDGSNKEIDAQNDWSIMQIAVDNNIDEIEGACGGGLACATCHVYVHPDWAQKVNEQDFAKCDEEEDMLDLAFNIHDTSRLGCQIRMNDALDGLIVALPGAKIDW